MTRVTLIAGLLAAAVLATNAGGGEIRVQDIARLQGQRTNKLMGYGLVCGLPGTGDGEKYASTMRALIALHRRYHAPVIGEADLKGNKSVAIVSVELTIPEYGAREGQTLDVVVSSLGTAKSLAGGQLLTTPLQFALFDPDDPATQQIFALAGGHIELPDKEVPTRGIIRAGATLEADFFYSFIEGQYITLVLDDEHAGWTWAHMLARAINYQPSRDDQGTGRLIVEAQAAEALGPKNVRVRIPTVELAHPSGFISRVLQKELFMFPEQQARVVINRNSKVITLTGSVTVSPTVLQIPGFGTVVIGGAEQEAPAGGGTADSPQAGRNVAAGPRTGRIECQELLETLSSLKVSPEQQIKAIEHLHKTGTLHAQLRYEE